MLELFIMQIFSWVNIGMLAFDPTGFLSSLGITYEKSPTPVQYLNFTDMFGTNVELFDKYFAWDMECMHEGGRKFMRENPPIALFNAMRPNRAWKEPYDRIFYPHHMIQCIRVNTNNHPIEYREKEFFADALLGQPREHRWVVFNRMRELDLLGNSLVNLVEGRWEKFADITHMRNSFPVWGIPKAYTSPRLHEIDPAVRTLIESTESEGFASTESLPGQKFWVSAHIPREIYDACHYSVVSETTFDNTMFFPTEKISKPLLAGRVFVVAGSQHFLRNLRSLGFETFPDIIDESYDERENHIERASDVVHALKALEKEDPRKIFDKVKARLLHNQQMMTVERLSNDARTYLSGFIRAHQLLDL